MKPILLTAAAAAVLTAGGVAVVAGTPATAHADPAPPPCGSPEVPCAGPSPLTPEQQCALIAWRTWMPCNWAPGINMQVPAGTPGSL
ncbi:hypothetical protein BST20_28715 [Mycobacterium branderi]|uniref:Secreted protein n=1 Tax=Mycobacterium branderi TaxID=43348 RepID=A0AA91LSA5_9MYCO|nr:hypothetical protein BST20_28715 [Mycobacterium branderi]